MANLKETLSGLSELSIEELKTLNSTVIDVIKAKRRMNNATKKSLFSIGDVVIIDHKKCVGKEFFIHAINRTKAVVYEVIEGEKHQALGVSYNVPFSLIELKE